MRGCQELRKRATRVLVELSIDDRDAAEGELVRSLHHVRDLSLGVPLERLVCAEGRRVESRRGRP